MSFLKTSDHEVGQTIDGGPYKLVIKKMEITPNSKKTGELLKVQFVVAKGDDKGAMVLETYNTKNPSEIAERISREQLSEMTRSAFGSDKDFSSEEEFIKKMVGKTVDAQVGINQSEGHRPRNVIEYFLTGDAAEDTEDAPWSEEDNTETKKKKKDKKKKKGKKKDK